jgi:electron transfer flavoprotein beta subunit
MYEFYSKSKIQNLEFRILSGVTMPNNKLDILVLLRESNDPRPPVRLTARGAGISDRGLRRVPNPADLAALEEALFLKDSVAAKVTVLAIGPKRLEDTLRLGISMGADRAIRFWDHGSEGADTMADARVLARILTILSPSLLFTGNRMVDRGDDPVPALAAASAGMPCITAAIELAFDKNGITALRSSDRGARQNVSASLPSTVLFEEIRIPRYPSVDDITRSITVPVESWDLASVGLPFWEIGATGAYLTAADYSVPRPDPVRVVTPDPSLPAFERILSLLSGGIKARAGKVNSLPVDSTVDSLIRIFEEEGLLEGSA